uniref:Bactericidal permeability-increasing protein n=1 Tax=Esox lucius TaxID=8010 RepID=A0A6Q2XTG8_ESOLU
MSPCCWLALLALVSPTLATNPGVKLKLTEKAIEYGKQIGIATLQQKLKTIQIPDIAGTEKVSPIGKVKYSLTEMKIVNLGLPKSDLTLVPGTGISLSITNAFINLHGNWRVRYLHVIKDSGSFDLAVSGLTVTDSLSILSDETGRPTVRGVNCEAIVGSASVKFHGGASWLYNLFSSFIDKALRSAMQKQICPLVADAINDMNQHLKTLNVLAKVDNHAEIEYSMVTPPSISKSSIDLNLKVRVQIGLYGAGDDLPHELNGDAYLSAILMRVNLGHTRTDNIPPSSPIRLNTRTLGTFVPEISKRFPGLMVELLVQTVKEPTISFQPNNVTVQASCTMTAYAVQTNSTLTPLFILNMEGSVSARLFVAGVMLAGAITLNKFEITLGTSYVGPFQVQSLDNIFRIVLKDVVIPQINVRLEKGFPLPTIGKMELINTELQVLKGYMLIGTDVKFT